VWAKPVAVIILRQLNIYQIIKGYIGVLQKSITTVSRHYFGLPFVFLSLAPSPPPFSSMNSTPAVSRAAPSDNSTLPDIETVTASRQPVEARL
jgi:hypothetical protein